MVFLGSLKQFRSQISCEQFKAHATFSSNLDFALGDRNLKAIFIEFHY